MKIKHFLRGLGTGIIFSAIVLMVAYMVSGKYQISDKEVIERAKKLGMVMAESETEIPAEDGSGDSDERSDPGPGSSDATEDQSNTAENKNDAEASSQTVADTEDETETNQEEEGGADTQVDTGLTKATITVTAGMSSTQVAQLLEDAGIITDHLDFDNYLNQNGYSTQIRINTYEFNSNMTYDEIAQALIKEDE